MVDTPDVVGRYISVYETMATIEAIVGRLLMRCVCTRLAKALKKFPSSRWRIVTGQWRVR